MKLSVREPQTDASQTDAPHVHAPHVHAPQVDAPQVDAPQVDAPQVDAPVHRTATAARVLAHPPATAARRTGDSGRPPAVGNAAIHRMVAGPVRPPMRAGLGLLSAGGSQALHRLAAPVQPKLTVSRPGDPLERQADMMADRITSYSGGPAPVTQAATPAFQAAAAAPGDDVGADLPPGLDGVLRAPGSGAPLPPDVQARIEPHLGAGLADVRVHTGERAQQAAAALGARAFTSGRHIWLGAGESPTDLSLMAHESTHVAQQQAVAGPPATLLREADSIIPDFILDAVRSYAKAVPGYDMLTVVAGYDPIAGQTVVRTPESLVRAVIGLVPFGSQIAAKLFELGILQEAFRLVNDGLNAHQLTMDRINREIDQAWNELSVDKGIDGNVAVITGRVDKLYNDVLAFAKSILDAVVQMIRDAAVGLAEKYLVGTPVWDLTRKVLHYDPLRGTPVEATTVEILTDFLKLIGKQDTLAQMQERGTLQKTADWLDTQIPRFLSLISELGALFAAGWAAIQPANIANLPDNLSKLARDAVGLVQRVAAFAGEVITTVLKIIKDALLGWLSTQAHGTRGFKLLTVIIGQDPFTGAPVPRTAENLIGGFIELIAGPATYAKLAEAGVIADAAAQVETAMGRLGISLDLIINTFLGVWNALTLEDLLNPVGAFMRVLDKFGEPLGRIVAFAGEVLKVVITLILKLMNFPSDLLGSIINNAMQAIEDIKRDPVAFFVNMLQALKAGLSAFLDKVLSYLLSGLADWLFRGLGQLGISRPPDLSLKSILDLVLQVLGVTTEKLWQKLGKQIGEENVAKIRGAIDTLTGVWAFIKDVQEGGVAAIWKHVEAQLGNLWDTILNAAKDWIVTEIIEKVTAKLLSMLDPTGIMAVVNSMIAFFNAVQSAIEYLREILQIVNDYVTTLAAVAAGNIAAGAVKVERGLANAVPVAIGFLANQVGLGNVPEKVVEIIQNLRQLVDEALDWLFEQAMRLGKAALNFITGGPAEGEPGAPAPGEQDAGPWDPPRVKAAAKAKAATQLAGPHRRQDIDAILGQILAEFQARGLVSLTLGQPTADGSVPVVAVASPPEELLRLTPRRRTVRMIVTLTVTGEPLAGVTPQLTKHQALDEEGNLVPADDMRAMLPPTTTEGKGAEPRTRYGGFLMPPARGSDQIEVVTWNTGELDPKVRSNASHAEAQFVQWSLKPENRQLLRRTKGIKVDMYDWNPCAACASDLNRVKGWLPKDATATLLYREEYPGESGLAALVGDGWTVQFAGNVPAGPGGEELVAPAGRS